MMQKSTFPFTRDLILVGGGHAHIGVLRSFAMKPMAGLRISLINQTIQTPYSGMLPGFIAGHYQFDEFHIDLPRLARFANARFIHDKVISIDMEKSEICLASQRKISFDLISFNIGSTPNFADIAGARQYAIPVKPISEFIHAWREISKKFTKQTKNLPIAVIGAGAGGVELALAMQYALGKKQGENAPQIHIFQRSAVILPSYPKSVRGKITAILAKRKMITHCHVTISHLEKGIVALADGQKIQFSHIFLCTNAKAPDFLHQSKIYTDQAGFIQTRPSLQSCNYDMIFAAGDIASIKDSPYPKAGVFAVRQSPILTYNLRQYCAGKQERLRNYRPQRNFLTLLATGDQYAVGHRGRFVIAGKWVWRLKDYIDRKFMTRFCDLAPKAFVNYGKINKPELPTLHAAGLGAAMKPDMLCAGCGAKTGADVLADALTGLAGGKHSAAIARALPNIGAIEDSAVLPIRLGENDAGRQMIALQSVDHFPAFTDDPYLLGEIAALHALNDLWSCGAKPIAGLALVTLQPDGTNIQKRIFHEIILASAKIFAQSDAMLIGGHTAVGEKMMIGFAVTGLVDKTRLWRKGAMAKGDKLIITKPLGSGVLLAADMRLGAKGEWVANAFGHMRKSNARASEIFARHHANAMTDISGFGLIGHLREMLAAAKQKSAKLIIENIPFMAGAVECLQQGFASMMQKSNEQIFTQLALCEDSHLSGEQILQQFPMARMLCDPQTSGGLLASIPGEYAKAALDALYQEGYSQAAIIGEITAAKNTPKVTFMIGK